jgi:hypothetical protein
MDLRELEQHLSEPEERVEFALGVADFYMGKKERAFASLDYRARGAAVYSRLRSVLAHQLCDPETRALRPWVALAAEGDARDLALVLLTIASTSAGFAASVSVPLAALMARRGLKDICQELRPVVPAFAAAKRRAAKKK